MLCAHICNTHAHMHALAHICNTHAHMLYAHIRNTHAHIRNTHMHTYVTNAHMHTYMLYAHIRNTHNMHRHTHMLYAHTHTHACMHAHSQCSYIQEEMFSKNLGGKWNAWKRFCMCFRPIILKERSTVYIHIICLSHTHTQQWWLFSLAVLNNENNGYHMTHTHTYIRYSNDWLADGYLSGRILRILGRNEKAPYVFLPLFSRKERKVAYTCTQQWPSV